MALIDITPIMTAYNKPEPYVASASTEYSGLSAFNAFRNPTGGNSTGWRCTDGDSEKWIQLDFGEVVGVSAIKITPRTGVPEVESANAKVIKVSGFDGSNWIDIYENSDETALIKGKVNLIEFNSMWNFSKFRIQVLKTFKGGNGFVNISRINFLYDDKFLEPIMPVSYKNATLEHTLPMNTTEKILSKKGDARLGLLGLANDGENFGDLYVVGRDGRSHLTKAGVKSEIIFEGKANASGTYTLTKPIKDFKFINIIVSVDHNVEGKDCYKQGTYIPVNEIIFSNYRQFINNMYDTNYISYGFTDEKTLNVNAIGSLSSGWKSIQVKKIIGIY